MAAKKVGGGKTPPKTSPKKTTKKPLTAYQKAIKVPDRSKDKNLKPYDAKWRADVKRKNDAYNRSLIHKYVEPGSQIFGRMAVIASLAEAASGRDLSTPANVHKKKNRVLALSEAALAATPIKGVRQVVRAVRNPPKNKPKANIGVKTAAKKPTKVSLAAKPMWDSYVQSEVNKMTRQAAKKAKTKTVSKPKPKKK